MLAHVPISATFFGPEERGPFVIDASLSVIDDNRFLVRRPGVGGLPSPHEPGLIWLRLRFDDGARSNKADTSRRIGLVIPRPPSTPKLDLIP